MTALEALPVASFWKPLRHEYMRTEESRIKYPCMCYHMPVVLQQAAQDISGIRQMLLIAQSGSSVQPDGCSPTDWTIGGRSVLKSGRPCSQLSKDA